eukprot:12030008-Ditylum_brightwellii.AAC.1
MEKTKSLEMSVKADFTFGIAGNTNTIKGDISKTVSQAMLHLFSMTTQETYHTNCLNLGPVRKFLWQWKVETPSNVYGPGFTCMSSHFVCTRGGYLPPKCPLRTFMD